MNSAPSPETEKPCGRTAAGGAARTYEPKSAGQALPDRRFFPMQGRPRPALFFCAQWFTNRPDFPAEGAQCCKNAAPSACPLPAGKKPEIGRTPRRRRCPVRRPAEKIGAGVQRLRNSKDGFQRGDACSPFDVPDVCGGQIGPFAQLGLRQTRALPRHTDALSHARVIQFRIHLSHLDFFLLYGVDEIL